MKLKSKILQFINKELMTELNSIAMDVLIPDNNTKVNLMVAALDKHNVPFSELGPGTNRLAILIDGYVFKIAMDKAGVIDNWSELSLSQELQPFVTKAYECNGLIVVSEYVTVISKDEFNNNKEEVRQILSHLAEGYLLGDVGSVNKNFMNWGYRPDGSLVILDYAYIYRVIGDEMVCGGLNKDDTLCDGNLSYDENFHNLRCPKCGRNYTFHEIRRKISRDYEEKEREAIKQIAHKLLKASQEVNIEISTNVIIENTNKGEPEMSKYDDYREEHEQEFDDSVYDDAIEFMKNFNNKSNNIIEDNDQAPIITNFKLVDETAEKLEDEEDLTPVDDSDDEDETDLSIDDLFAIIDQDSSIEEENDELEDETGISDEDLDDMEVVLEEETVQEPKDTIEEINEFIEEVNEFIEEVSNTPLDKEIETGNVVPVEDIISEDKSVEIIENEEKPHVDSEAVVVRVEEPENGEPATVEIIAPAESKIDVTITSSTDNSSTVKLEDNDGTLILTAPENVDKMRALLSEDIEEDDEWDDEYEKMYDENVNNSKIRKSHRDFI